MQVCVSESGCKLIDKYSTKRAWPSIHLVGSRSMLCRFFSAKRRAEHPKKGGLCGIIIINLIYLEERYHTRYTLCDSCFVNDESGLVRGWSHLIENGRPKTFKVRVGVFCVPRNHRLTVIGLLLSLDAGDGGDANLDLQGTQKKND